MLVRAIQTGYYGNKRIREGQIFELKSLKIQKKDPKTQRDLKVVEIPAEQQFSELWMEKLEKSEEKKLSKKPVIQPDLNDNEEVI